ncbi:MAG: hypothetical protein A2068_07500 [Ignavibacteria bacterium GWB2_35_6b]|nr:MAG: hypothetical protein A2068_07500 [Ignavibacteria bacterium GWB2_35_6b]
MNFSDLPGFVSVLLFLIFSVFLFTLKKGRKRSNYLLGAFFQLSGLQILGFLIYNYADNRNNILIHFLTIGDSFLLLIGPVFYFYTLSITKPEFKFLKKDLLHLIPFIIFIIISIIKFHSKTTEVKYELLKTHAILGEQLILYVIGFINVQIIIYVSVSLLLLKKYNAELKKYFSSLKKINLSWLKLFFAGFISVSFLDLLNFLLNKLSLNPIFSYNSLNDVSLILNLMFASAIIFNGLRNPKVFYGILAEQEKEKFIESAHEPPTNNFLLEKLLSFMKEKKPFLNSSLTLNELAKISGIPARTISQLINEKLNKNFFDFINEYRIEESIKILSDKENFRKTIQEILYESGFNSKSVFNTVFKKFTGKTPTEFRKGS